MAWKTWIVLGLVLQVLAVIPPALLVLPTSRATFSQEHGVVVAMKDKAGSREWLLILGGFGLVAAGSICQIVGLLNSP